MATLPLILALLAQAATPQPDWRPLGTSVAGRETTYDAASIVRAGPVTRVRLRFVEADSYALSTVELRCAAYEARGLGSVSYDLNGVERSRNEMISPFRAIIAGTILDALRAAVCVAGQAQPAQ